MQPLLIANIRITSPHPTIALGFDAHEKDPMRMLNLPTRFFGKATSVRAKRGGGDDGQGCLHASWNKPVLSIVTIVARQHLEPRSFSHNPDPNPKTFSNPDTNLYPNTYLRLRL